MAAAKDLGDELDAEIVPALGNGPIEIGLEFLRGVIQPLLGDDGCDRGTR